MPTKTVTTPRDPARRRRILDAAKRHFTARGFKGTNLDAIAAEAGCAKGALYLEFPDKRALLREVVEETAKVVGARYAAEVLSIESPLERLVAALRFTYHQTAAEPIFAKLMREDPDLKILQTADEAETARAAKAQVAMIASWVDDGIARGEIRPDVDRDAIPCVLAVLKFVPQHLGVVTQLGLLSGERTLEALVDVFRAGLAAKPDDAKPQNGSKRTRATRGSRKAKK